MNNIRDNIQQYADELVHGLLSAEVEQQVLQCCQQYDDCRDELDRARKRLKILQSVELDNVSEELLQSALARGNELSPKPQPKKSTTDKKDMSFRKTERVLWSGLAVAAMFVLGLNLVWSQASPPTLNMMVFGQDELFVDTNGSLRVIVEDQGQPVAGRQVNVDLFSDDASRNVRLVSFETDQHGTGLPQFRLPDWPLGEYRLTVSLQDSSEDVVSRKVSLKRNWHLMLSSDKLVYQPGQTVHLRSLARMRSNSEPVFGKEVTFRVLDPKGNLVAIEKTISSEFGISSMDLPLANEVIEGAWKVECEIENVISDLAINVQKYVLPKFSVDVSLDQPWFEPSDQIRGTIKSDYFFGKPVSGAATMMLEPTIAGQAATELASMSVVDGEAKFEFAVPSGLYAAQPESGDTVLKMVVKIQDDAGQVETKTVSTLITKRPLRLEMVPESGALVSGVKNRIYVFATYADGTPAEVGVSISGLEKPLRTNRFGVANFDFEPAENRRNHVLVASAIDSAGRVANREINLGVAEEEGGFVLRTDKSVYKGGDSMVVSCFSSSHDLLMLDVIRDRQTLMTRSIDVSNGKGESVIDLPADLEGALEINVYRITNSRNMIRKTRKVFVSLANDLRLEVLGAKQTHRPGESANLRLKLTDKQGQPMRGAVGVSIVDSAVSAVASQRLGLLTSIADGDAALLQPLFTVYPWLPSLGEGDAEQQEFEEAAFAYVDSLENRDDIQIAYIVENFLEGDWSLLDALDSPEADEILESMPWIPKEDVQFLRGENVYSISDRTAAMKMSRFKQKQWQRKEWAKALWRFLGFVFFALGMWSIFKRLGLGIKQVLVALFLLFMLIGMMLPAVQQVREAARKTVVANKIRQLGLGVDNSKSASHAASKHADGAPRIRKWFPETLLWRPQLITDDKGEVELGFPLADTITTWKVNAQAVSSLGRLGSAVEDLVVFQPFFVDVDLPVAFTRGDEVAVPVVIYNYLNETQKVTLSVRDESWFELSGAAEQSVTVEAGQQKVIELPLRIVKAGNHKLQLTAMGSNGISDAIEKDVRVDYEGSTFEAVVNGTLEGQASTKITIPDDAVNGSGQVIVKVYPSRFSQLVEGLDGIFQRPHGCFEQTSSTTYPSVLALSYLKSTKQSMPEVEIKAMRYIQEGYQRLLTFEVPGGGFEWFGKTPANTVLTAYGLMEFRDIDAIYSVDEALISRTKSWLMSQRNSDGSWDANRRKRIGRAVGDQAKLATTAYIAWSIFDDATAVNESKSTCDWILNHRPKEVESSHTLALACNALLRIAQPDQIQPWIDELLARAKTDGQKLTWWETRNSRTPFYGSGKAGDIETTATAVLALMSASQGRASSEKALRWLVSQRDSLGTWHTSQATVLTLKALLSSTQRDSDSDVDRQVDLMRDGNRVKRFEFLANRPIVEQFVINNLGAGESMMLELGEHQPSGFGFQITTRHNAQEQPAAKSPQIAIELNYDAKNLKVNDELSVTACVASHLKTSAAMVMVTLPVPPGFSPDMSAFDGFVKQRKIEKYEQTKQRIVLYLRSVEPGELLEFTYRLIATMPMKVTAKPAVAWLYYDPQVRTASGEVQLEVQR